MGALDQFLGNQFAVMRARQLRDDAFRRRMTERENIAQTLSDLSVPRMTQQPLEGPPTAQEAMLSQLGVNPMQDIIKQQGLFTPQQADVLSGLLTSSAPGAVGLGQTFGQSIMSQLTPQTQDPTSLMQNAAAAGLVPGTPEYADFIRQAVLKPNTTVNVGASEKPLSISDINKLQLPDGSKPPIGVTPSQAAQMGAVVVTTDQQKSQQAAREMSGMAATIANVAFPEDKPSLFPPDKAGVIDRAGSGLSAWRKSITQSDERITIYNDAKNATVSGLARLAGQVGTLTDRDVDIVAGLWPIAGFTPESIARTKFKQIGTLLQSKGVPEEMLEEIGIPKWALTTETPPPPPGFNKVVE